MSKQIKSHDNAIYSVRNINGVILATGSADCTIKLWSAHNYIDTLFGHQESVISLEANEDYLFSADINNLKLWDIEHSKCIGSKKRKSIVMNSLKMLYSNLIISSHHCNDEIGLDINLTDVRSLQLASKIETSARIVWSTAVLNENTIISGCDYGYVNFFDIRMNCSFYKISLPDSVNSLEIDNHFLYLGSGNRILRINLERKTFTLFGEMQDKVIALKLFKKKYLISSSNCLKLNCWDIKNLNLISSENTDHQIFMVDGFFR